MTSRDALPLPPLHTRTLQSLARHRGRALPWALGALLVAGVAGAGLWWRQAHSADAPAAGASATGGGAGAGGPGRFGGGGGGGGPGGPGGRFGAGSRVQPVQVAAVQRREIRINVNAIGSIAAANTAVVRTRIDGELLKIHFKEGQMVKAGALLAELDARALRITLAQTEGQLTRDQAQLQNARLDLQRFKDLLAKDAIAKQQVDTQEALVRQLQGTVQTDQAQVDNAKLQLSYTRIVAPISGRAGLKQADLGNVVHSSDPNGLVTIAQTQPVNVVFAVPDSHLQRLHEALDNKRPLKVEAWDREGLKRLAVGRLGSIDNAIDAATGTVKLKARFDNDDETLYPNQFVNVRLQVATLEDALAVPVAALLRGGDGNFVYVVGEDKTVAVRKVQAGPGDADWVSVKGDLQPGDLVVTDGVDRLREGAQVEVVKPPVDAPDDGRGGRRRRGGPGGPGGGASAPAGAGSAAAAGPRAGAEAGNDRRGEGRGEPQGGDRGPRAGNVGANGSRGEGQRGDAPRADGGRGPGGPGGAGGPGGDFLSRLPPEVAEKIKAMSPDERRAFFEQRRAERAKREAAGQ